MLKLFRAELKRNWIIFKRYPTEAVSGVLGITIVFYGLFLSFKYVGGAGMQFGDRLDSVIVSYVLWSLTLFVIGDIAQGLQREAQTGTLEQIFLSPFSAMGVFLLRAFASLTTQLTLTVGILLLIMLLTGTQLSFSFVLLLPLGCVLLGAYGFALGIGALALLIKQVQQLLGIFQFMLFFVLLVPIESWAGQYQFVGWFLPMSPGAGLLRELMARGQNLDFTQFAIALLNGLVYFGFGLFAFHWAERRVKQHGKLAGY